MRVLESLPADPVSVGLARRLVAQTLRKRTSQDMLDTALLLVSELVTNAILHAGTDVLLAIDDEHDRIRIEVADASPALPAPRAYDDDASTGRGLGLVEMLAGDFGVERRGGGKVVWFTLGEPDPHDADADAEALIERWADADSGEPTPVAETIDVELRGLPVHLFRAMQQHNDALLREHALMSGVTYRPPDLAIERRPLEEALRRAEEMGSAAIDAVVPARPDAAGGARRLLDMLGAADERALAGSMLTPAALPEVRWCRAWFLGEVAGQVNGTAPHAWTPLDVHHRELEGLGEIDPRRVLDTLTDAVVVGDDQNRITYANQAAAELLGWKGGELEGKRLTTLVPERLREQHIAGYTRHLITGERRLIGRPVRVPARRRDGSEVPVELQLSTVSTKEGRRLFVAALRDLTDRLRFEEQATLTAALEASVAVVELIAARGSARLPDIAEEVLETVASRLGWQVAALWSAGEDLRCAAAWSSDRDQYAGFLAATRSQRFERGRGLPGRVWDARAPAVIPDVVADANFARAAAATGDGLRGAVAFPIVQRGEVVGVVELYSSEVLDPPPDLIMLLAAMGSHLGTLTRR